MADALGVVERAAARVNKMIHGEIEIEDLLRWYARLGEDLVETLTALVQEVQHRSVWDDSTGVGLNVESADESGLRGLQIAMVPRGLDGSGDPVPVGPVFRLEPEDLERAAAVVIVMSLHRADDGGEDD